MTVIKLGKTREATAFTSERFKTAIRTYMEAIGYAQLTDSSKEGHLPDMVFRALGNAPWPEVWAESKATELSLGDARLAGEIRAYLLDWLRITPESRFKFMLFAKKLINPTRWELVWGNNITESSALDWLTKDTDEETGQYFREPTRQREVVSFFSQAAVVEGTDLDLTDTASEKRRVGLSANEIRRRALRQIELMDQRSRPIPKKSELIANLLRLNPPSKYAELSVENHSIQGIQNMLRHRDTAPYYLPENGRLITLDHESTRAGFDILNPSQLGTLTLEQLEDKYPSSLSRLVNFAIGKILRPLGVGFSNGRAYFLAYREAKEGKPRRLELETGETLQVAKPYLSQANSEDLQVEGPRKLNFVFHQAFSLRYRKLWDQHFVEFRLGKTYTQDGAIPLEGRSTARLDTRFRNPAWDRSETRQRKMEKLAGFLFHSKRRTVPRWIEAFNFGNFLRIPTEWTPDAVPLDQAVMDDFEVTDEGGDE